MGKSKEKRGRGRPKVGYRTAQARVPVELLRSWAVQARAAGMSLPEWLMMTKGSKQPQEVIG